MKHIPNAYYLGVWLLLILSCTHTALAAGRGASPGKVRKKPVPTKVEPFVPEESAPERRRKEPIPLEPEGRTARYKLNNLLGLHVVKNGGFLIGSQFGYAVLPGKLLYVGPELNFTLLSDGHLFSMLGGGWYEMQLLGSQTLNFHAGALGGVMFARDVSTLAPVNLAVYLDLAVVQDMDDLVSIRGQFRPGYVANRFAFMTNLNITFRFY